MSMRATLITLGDPERLTGGHLYHRRVAELAPRFDASLTFAPVPDGVLRAAAAARRTLTRAARLADVVVCDSIVAAPLSLALERSEVLVVGMLHQEPGGIDGSAPRRLLQRPFDRAAYRRMVHLIVASEQLRRCLLQDGFPDDGITIAAPGCDPPSSKGPEAVGDLRDGTRVAFLCVGNWIRRKGIVDVLDAFALLPPDLGRLHLVGDDSVEPGYTRLVRRRVAKLSGRVLVHGPVSRAQVDALYRAADVFVLPSYREPYGTVYGEAMAAGLPVIGWRAGNLPYLIEPGREGLMDEPGDVAALAESMRRLALDDDLRARMSAAALQRGRSLPTWEETAETFFLALRRARYAQDGT
jgi:glycosyltransferase involved in cell wall biosynthesis